MDFLPPPTIPPLLEKLRTFMEAHVFPAEPLMHDDSVSLSKAIRPIQAAAREEELWMPQIAKDDGGMGLSLLEHAIVSEVLGESPLGHYALNCQAPDAGNMEILIEYGTDAQKERFLAPLLRGETRSCFAMTEPERPGSNPVWLKSHASIDSDEWVLNAHKWFTTGADGADFVIVMVLTDPGGKLHERASMFIVPMDTEGLTLVRNIPVMGDAGREWASHGELRFDGCRIPEGNLLGERGGGFYVAQARLGPGRIHHCMRWIGVCERALRMMCQRAATREVAPNDLLGNRQTIQNWIAESRAEIDAARLLVLRAAWKIQTFGASSSRADISAIKFFVAGIMQRVLDRSIQTHGALGITDDTVLSTFYRHERGARIYDGPDEVHKGVVARSILQDYGLKRAKR